MKKTVSLFLLILIIASLTACNEDVSSDSPKMNIDFVTDGENTRTMIKNGAEQYFFQVGEGEIVDVEMSFTNTSGTINAFISKDSIRENAIYTGNDIPSGTFTVVVREPGEYQIYYEASDYMGNYSYTVSKR